MPVRIAVIGGTGLYDPTVLKDVRQESVATRYGEVTVDIGTYAGGEVVFMARHGKRHSVPPHKINYRANIIGLKQIGVERVITTSAVGSLNKDMKPGDLVVVDQFIDFTKGRVSTFYDGEDGKVIHTDFTEPYCPYLRREILKAGKTLGLPMHSSGCYVCTEGPRFETPAEIRMFQYIGGDLVGMTNVPEVVLAREAGLCYSTIGTVTNQAAGISQTPLTHEEVLEVMRENGENIKKVIFLAIESIFRQAGSSSGAPGSDRAATAGIGTSRAAGDQASCKCRSAQGPVEA